MDWCLVSLLKVKTHTSGEYVWMAGRVSIKGLCYKALSDSVKVCPVVLANLLVWVVSLHCLPVDQVRPLGVDQGTEGLPVRPGGGHVVDVDPRVGVEPEPTPFLQGLTSRQSHPPTSLAPLSHHLLAIKTDLNTLSTHKARKPVVTKQSKYFQFKSEIFGKVVKFSFVAESGL